MLHVLKCNCPSIGIDQYPTSIGNRSYHTRGFNLTLGNTGINVNSDIFHIMDSPHLEQDIVTDFARQGEGTTATPLHSSGGVNGDDDGGGIPVIYLQVIGLIASIMMAWVLILVAAFYFRWCKPQEDLDSEQGTGTEPHLKEEPTQQYRSYQNTNSNPRKKDNEYDLHEVLKKQDRSAMKSLIESERLVIGDILRKGQFGVVYRGLLSSKETNKTHSAMQDVTVKTLPDFAKKQDVIAFLRAGLRMQTFNHPHVISILGVVARGQLPHILTPYMEHGDLKSYLTSPANVLTVRELVQLAIGVADGMSYLSKMVFVHRDLAARNCMLDKDKLVKISDYSLYVDPVADDLYEVHAERRVAVRWAAPECFLSAERSSKTDVWSFGVLLWELFTRGSVPFDGLTNEAVIHTIQRGERLDRPQYAPDKMGELMKHCWRQQPAGRPSFPACLETTRELFMRSVVPTQTPTDSLTRLGVAPTAPC